MGAFTDPAAELDSRQLDELLRSGADVQVIDVREPYEREAGHIPDTVHIELERLAGRSEEVDRDRPVVFYCRLGVRSAMATQAFRSSGWDARSLAGGIAAWADAGLPLAPDGGYVADH